MAKNKILLLSLSTLLMILTASVGSAGHYTIRIFCELHSNPQPCCEARSDSAQGATYEWWDDINGTFLPDETTVNWTDYICPWLAWSTPNLYDELTPGGPTFGHGLAEGSCDPFEF